LEGEILDPVSVAQSPPPNNHHRPECERAQSAPISKTAPAAPAQRSNEMEEASVPDGFAQFAVGEGRGI
jgi:hypothetical protein